VARRRACPQFGTAASERVGQTTRGARVIVHREATMHRHAPAIESNRRDRPGMAEWAGVVVRDVHFTPIVGHGRAQRTLVSACVETGAILPSDVLVVARWEGLGAPLRLFSTHPYGPGCFAFEAPLPAVLPSRARGITVSVWPADAARAGAGATAPLSSRTISLPALMQAPDGDLGDLP
jgi:hypothetical protein